MTSRVKFCSSRVFAARVMLTLNPRDARKKEMSPAVTTKTHLRHTLKVEQEVLGLCAWPRNNRTQAAVAVLGVVSLFACLLEFRAQASLERFAWAT
jgi:hypothetical protein